MLKEFTTEFKVRLVCIWQAFPTCYLLHSLRWKVCNCCIMLMLTSSLAYLKSTARRRLFPVISNSSCPGQIDSRYDCKFLHFIAPCNLLCASAVLSISCYPFRCSDCPVFVGPSYYMTCPGPPFALEGVMKCFLRSLYNVCARNHDPPIYNILFRCIV